MDPLSVTAAVVGLLTAAHEIIKLLQPYVSAAQETPPIAAHVRDEAESTRTVLVGLQAIVHGLAGKNTRRGALIGIDQIVVILTGGVLLFAELEGAVRDFVAAPALPHTEGDPGPLALSTARYRLPLRARLQWARGEKSLGSLLTRLQGFKVSITAVLTLLQCDSDLRAEQLQIEIAANISALLDSNRDLSRRMMHLEGAFDVQTIRSRSRQSITSNVTATRPGAEGDVAATEALGVTEGISSSVATNDPDPVVIASTTFTLPLNDTAVSASVPVVRSIFEFETDLEASHVYRRAQRDTMDFSFRSSVARTHAWSMLSGRSLADVSELSVIALPLDLEDVTNSQHYISTNHQQLTPVSRKDPSPLYPESLLMGERSIFHDCIRISSRLVQIRGFQELFAMQWLEQGVDGAVIKQWEDNRESSWHQLDVFRAIKTIFQGDVPYRLLADKLGRNIDTEMSYYSGPPSKAVQKAISQIYTICVNLGFGPNDMFSVNDALGDDNVCFLKVLAWVNKVLDRLASDGTICLTNEDHFDSRVPGIWISSLLPNSNYKYFLVRFVDVQRSFVQDLLVLISKLEQLAQRSPLLGQDHPHISSSFFSSYANSEIELLLTIEKMLLSPFHRHLWASAVRQWCVIAETHRTLVVIQDRKVKQALCEIMENQALPSGCNNNQTKSTNLKLILSCIELLSRPSQMLIRAIQFFQEIFTTLLGDSVESTMISPAQKEDFAEGRRLVRYTHDVVNLVNRRIRLDLSLERLFLCVEDWKNCSTVDLGPLLQTDVLNALNGDHPMKKYHVYLFENIILLLRAFKPAAVKRRGLFRLTRTVKVVNPSTKLFVLRLMGRIYPNHVTNIRSLRQNGYHKIQLSWKSGSSGESTVISFMNKEQMLQWYESLLMVTSRYNTLLTVPNMPSVIWQQEDTELENRYLSQDDDDDQGHQGNAELGGRYVTNAETTETIPLVLLPPQTNMSQFRWIPPIPKPVHSSERTSKPTRPSPTSQSSLSPPPLLKDRPLLQPAL
ncbi:Pleckstrin homology domain-containing protein [Xylaria arbuscula]|nr:Pleckstrin homology domain-containing protein [Xylaria arbuscula]